MFSCFFSLSCFPFSSSLMSAPFSSTHLPCDLLLPLWLGWLKKCCSSQAANTWTKLSPTGTLPSGRYAHAAVATAVGFFHVWRSKLRGSRQLRDLKKAMPGPVEPLHRIPSPEGGFFNDLYLYNVGEARHSED